MKQQNSFAFEGKIVAFESPGTVFKVWIEQTTVWNHEPRKCRIPVTFFGDKAIALRGRLSVGQDVIASGRLGGREYQGRWYIDLLGSDCIMGKAPNAAPVPVSAEADVDDDLPFSI